VFPQRTFFDTGQDALRPEAQAVVDVVAETLRYDAPDVAVFIAGHTDPRGDRDYNQNLSVDRANAVADTLRNANVPTGTIWRIGFGPDMPLVPNESPEAWGFNRRVEFLFAAKEQAVGVWLADIQVDSLCSSRSKAESSKCKRSINLRREYQAVEVMRQSVNAKIKRTNESTDLRGTTVAIEEITKPIIVIAPVAKRMSINPISRTATVFAKGA